MNSELNDNISNKSHTISNNRLRGFMGSNSNIINNNHSFGHNNTSIYSDDDKGTSALLWGTKFNVKDVENRIIKFIFNFNINNNSNEEFNYYYEKLKDIKIHEDYNITVEAIHIHQFDNTLYLLLIFYPAETIMYFDKVVNSIYKEHILNEVERNNLENQILTKLIELKSKNIMRELEPSDINHLISISGIVIRTSNVIPEMKDAYFKCTKCFDVKYFNVDRGRIPEPKYCTKCNSKSSYDLIHNLCIFTDKQYIKLQETPDNVPEGDTPNYVTLISYDDIVDSCKPGDKIEVTGIYRVQANRISKEKTTLKNTFGNYIDVVSVTSFKREALHNKDENINNNNKINNIYDDENNENGFGNLRFTESEELLFKQFSKNENIYEKLLESFAPSIWEYEHVKLGLLCQLFGGTLKNFESQSRTRFRNDINILLVGDPSTAKSQLLKFVNSINSRGIYTSGKGSSAVGLTASISKDPETKEVMLQSGALILSDKGICCIDEFDKMDYSTKTILHEVMEQQTISIAKAGIVCTLNARTSILAAANPKESKYNPKKSIIYNLETPPSLLSRFDLIYLMLDKRSDDNDRKLANHILSLYSKNNLEDKSVNVDKQFLIKYIQYCKNECRPKLTEEAQNELLKCYLEMRGLGNNKNIITATPRQLESLIRISEALTKMRLAEYVTKFEVIKAYELIKEATQKTAVDPSTGLIDMNKIITGFSSQANKKVSEISEAIKEIIELKEEYYKKGVKGRELLQELNTKFEKKYDIIEYLEMIEALKILEDESLLTISGNKKKAILIKLTNIN